MPVLAHSINEFKVKRQSIADARDGLLKNSSDFDADLTRLLNPWTDEVDPVTDRRMFHIESITGKPWGKRVRLFNGHRLEFVVDEQGIFTVFNSVDNKTEVYDGGFRKSIDGSASTMLLEKLLDEGQQRPSRLGTHLPGILDTFFAKALVLPEYVDAV